MRIQELTLKNFRGFEDLTVTFPEGEGGLAVFVGLNGSGKTSVLSAIRKCFGQALVTINNEFQVEGGIVLPKFLIPDYVYEFNNRERDINAKFNSFFLRLNLRNNEKWNFFEYEFYGDHINPTDQFRRLDLNKFLIDCIDDSHPIFINYSFDRAVAFHRKFAPSVTPVDKSQENKYFSLRDDFFYSFETKIDYRSFFGWFKRTEDLENEIRLNENSEYRDKNLSAVRHALSSFDLGFHNPRISRKNKVAILIVEKDSVHLSIDSLSEGERVAFAMFGDIAMRLAMSNSKLENPLLGKGIVLIDEIELHLHPSWQRKIIPALRRTFPNVQFIITTHSPQVISTCKKENVFILKDFQLQNTPHTQGRDSNSILQEIFGVEKRPPEFQKEFDKLYRLMDDPESVDLTKHMLNDVEEKYGFYDQEVIRARSFFEDLNNK